MSGAPIFGADAEGWRAMNSGRPAAELIREAVQNVFDEVPQGARSDGALKLDVNVEYEDGGVNFEIIDTVPGGIRDERLIWMIWLSDKGDSPNKRGRMGRGLKELISVADWSLIVSEGIPAVEFKRYRGKWTRTSPIKKRPKAGTVIEGRVKLWKKSDADAIVEHLRRMRPPEGLVFRVNDELVGRTKPTEVYRLKLPTVLFEMVDGERVAREPRREATVSLFPPEPGAAAWVFEMGIPVEPIDFPLSIDVGQRVPLREKRDTLTEPYRRELFAKILDERVRLGRVQPEQMRDNHTMIAAQAPQHLSTDTKKAISDAWTGGKAYAATPEIGRQASGQHIPVVPLRALPESIRDIAREVGTDVRTVLEERRVAACRTLGRHEHTEAQRRLTDTWEWIAAGIRRACRVELAVGQPSCGASFNRDSRTLTVYVEVLPRLAIEPLAGPSLAILIHELAHWQPHDNEHGFDFHSDAEDVGGAVASFLVGHAAEALEKGGV